MSPFGFATILIVTFSFGFVAAELRNQIWPRSGQVDFVVSKPDKDGFKTITMVMGGNSLGWVKMSPAALKQFASAISTESP